MCNMPETVVNVKNGLLDSSVFRAGGSYPEVTVPL